MLLSLHEGLVFEYVVSAPDFVAVAGELFVAGEGVVVGEEPISIEETARPPLLLPPGVPVLVANVPVYAFPSPSSAAVLVLGGIVGSY